MTDYEFALISVLLAAMLAAVVWVWMKVEVDYQKKLLKIEKDFSGKVVAEFDSLVATSKQIAADLDKALRQVESLTLANEALKAKLANGARKKRKTKKAAR